MYDELKKTNGYPYEISIIITTYNAVFDKLRKTLLSALLQQNIKYEIIVADDGSPNNCKDEIIKLFEDFQFTDYKLIMNPSNSGTIRNFLSGIKAAEGEFTKDISPGDFLSHENVLHDWLYFTKNNNYEWSFSEIIHYQITDSGEEYVSVPARPQNILPYLNYDEAKMRWNYIILDDIAVGCSIFGKTKIMRKYLEELLKTDNLYAEDNIYRLMMYDGVVGHYYPEATLFYEYGTGISTKKSDYWQQQLLKEYVSVFRLIEKKEKKSELQKKMQKYIKKKGKPFASFFIPGMIRQILKYYTNPRMFPVDFETTAEWRAKCR